jgi:hypothetical protein
MMPTHQDIHSNMRTTLDLDDDVLLAAKEHAARDRTSIGAALSALARQGLRHPAAAAPSARGGGRFAVLPRREETVTLEHVRTLADREGV